MDDQMKIWWISLITRLPIGFKLGDFFFRNTEIIITKVALLNAEWLMNIGEPFKINAEHFADVPFYPHVVEISLIDDFKPNVGD